MVKSMTPYDPHNNGPVETRDTLLDPRTLAKLHGLELRARHVVEGFVSGLHRSPYRGFSVEFAEHREYVPGDDLRHLDWKLFGRTDKFYLKRYEDETNLICNLLLDVSESMQYRSDDAPLSKFEYGQVLAAALGWLVLHQNDAVGLATFADTTEAMVRPGTSASHLQEIVRILEATSFTRKTQIGAVMHDLSARLRRRGVVIVISDLFDHISHVLAGLKHLRRRRHDVIVLHLLDPAEIDFPFQQVVSFRGLEGSGEAVVDTRFLKQAYCDELNDFLHRVKAGCRAQQIDYRLVRTDESLEVTLSRFLAAGSSS